MTDESTGSGVDRRTVLKLTGGSLAAMTAVGQASASATDEPWIYPQGGSDVGETTTYRAVPEWASPSGDSSYSWQVYTESGGLQDIGEGPSVDYTFETEETYDLRLWRSRDDGDDVVHFITTARGDDSVLPKPYFDVPGPMVTATNRDSDAEYTLDASPATAIGDRSIESYQWRLRARWKSVTDSLVETYTGEQPTVEFPKGGAYLIELTVTDDDGNEAVRTRPCHVTGEGDVPPNTDDISWPVQQGDAILAGTELTFDASGASDSDGGPVETCQWTFFTPDGSDNVLEKSVTKRFTTPGEVHAQATLTDDERQKAESDQVSFTVEPATWLDINDLPETVDSGTSINPSVSISVNENKTLDIVIWSLERDGENVEIDSGYPDASQGEDVTRSYTSPTLEQPGQYTLDVTAQHSDSSGQSTAQQFVVELTADIAVTEAPDTVTVGDTIAASSDGSNLSDADIESIEWMLELDGTTVDTGTGASFESAPVESAGSYDLTVRVRSTDGSTAEDATTVEVTEPERVGESGVATFDQPGPDNWTAVTFENSFTDPVVVPGPAQYNGGNPTTVRGRNVTSDGFELQIDEWAYLDDWHTEESVPWLAVENGTHTIDGQTVEAGTAEVGSDFTNVSLSGEYSNTPVVITACMSRSGSQPVTTRQRPPSQDGFDVRLQTEEAAGSASTETVHYIAVDPDQSGPLVAWRQGQVTDDWSTISYDGFDSPPVVVASQQTFNGPNTATLRYRNRSAGSIDMFVEEEQSKDDETGHIEEVVGWVALAPGTF